MSSIFWPRPKDTISAFLKARGINKPYFLCVGARYGYKNYGIFWDGIKLLPKSVRDKYMVVLVGDPEPFSYMDTMNLKVRFSCVHVHTRELICVSCKNGFMPLSLGQSRLSIAS